MKSILAALLVLLFSASCHHEELTPKDLPACIQSIISQNGSWRSGDRLIAIYRYKYQKRYVYLGISDCCDFYNFLFDNNCQILCAPNGGFSGGGDGKCPDFSKEATEQTEIWVKPQ
ncbi:DUF6970 domain-containing protein [Spirosoma sp. KNUC1025]|uniref:DUF6970 domain-containing protein n=1 Tax=Spirosoma sp. KNUC1025 TaxID=2894082 RepID=UPI003862F1A3|nr:hypothetical protein LN737_27010 [Spirosoma sp. KNUC1025]